MRFLVIGVLGALLGGGLVGILLLVQNGRSQTAVLSPQAVQSSLTEATAAAASSPVVAASVLVPSAVASSSVVVPILVYHIVRPSLPTDSAAVRAIAVTPEIFDAQLHYLKTAGYHVIDFHMLEDHFASSTPLPEKPLILSFDDGWSDQYMYAFPILKKYGDTATFFVFTNAINHKGFLTWADLHTFLESGMTIGDHTRSHPYLSKITDPQKLWDEIDGSKRLLEEKLGVTITEFAYPFGQHDPQILSMVKQAGYRSARGDYWDGWRLSTSTLYSLSALNAPITLQRLEQVLP